LASAKIGATRSIPVFHHTPMTMKATNPKAKQAGEPVFICANYTLLTDI